MYKCLLFSTAVSLFLCLSAFEYDPFPKCPQMGNDELAKCPAPLPLHANLSNPALCCQHWERASCEKCIRFALPECKEARFLYEVIYEQDKLKACTPAATCANVTQTNAAVVTIMEDILSSFIGVVEQLIPENCTKIVAIAFVNCTTPLNTLLDRAPSKTELCCDELKLSSCLQAAVDKDESCSGHLTVLKAAFKPINEKLVKKCPADRIHCLK